jgi:Lon protease-like protein
MAPGLTAERAPSNILLSKLLTRLCPEDAAIRAEFEDLPEASEDELKVPLFVCTLSFPDVPTFLHIFEPRYRLMVRRAVESGDRKFGMLLHNPSKEPQGELGRVPFYQYGTLLHIESMHLMPDGRSLIETIGLSRFRVLKYGQKDGYTIGKIERIDDITISEEETVEARETTPSSPIARSLSAADHFGGLLHHLPSQSATPLPSVIQSPSSTAQIKPSDLTSMSTRALYDLNVAFVKKMRENSAPWLHSRVFQAYGNIPDDIALFPWWFASVLPFSEKEKYKLLETSSVRERLKITCRWVLMLEGQKWYV